MSRWTSAQHAAPAGALAAALLAVGCSSTPEPELPSPGTTAFYVASQVGGACELSKIALAVDGRVQYKILPPDIPEPGGDLKLAGKIPLQPGSHAISLHASAKCEGSGPPGERDIVTLRDVRSFLVSSAPATVVIEINTNNKLKPADSPRLDAKLHVQGAELAPSIGPAGTIYEGGEVDAAGVDDRLCAGLPLSRRAICRAEAVLSRARERRDIVSQRCIQEKIARMRTYAVIVDRASERSQTSRDPPAADPSSSVQARDPAVIAMAEERIKSLAVEVGYCGGHEAMDPAATPGVRVLERP